MAEAAASWSGKRGCRDWGWRQRRSRTRPWGAAGLDGVLTAAVSLPLPRPLQPPPLTLPCSPRGRQATLCHGGGNEDADGSVAFAGATPAAGPPPPPSPRRPPPNSAARRRLRKAVAVAAAALAPLAMAQLACRTCAASQRGCWRPYFLRP
uniref:Uncharacterized protein n=1 Tax=Oryza nivara TaxID=4536 RepID=A0A0E0IAW6_ORYNI